MKTVKANTRAAQVIVPRCKPFNARLVRFLQSVLHLDWDKLPTYQDITNPAGCWYAMHKQPLPEIVLLQQNFDLIPTKRFTRLGYSKSTFAVIKSMPAADALDFIKRHL